jgi:Leucine-rich repeat (LRR) protein
MLSRDEFSCIFEFIDFDTTLNCLATNTHFNEILSDDKYWIQPYRSQDQRPFAESNYKLNYLKYMIMRKIKRGNPSDLIEFSRLSVSIGIEVTIPKEICLFTELRVLNLAHNGVSSIPSEIGALTNLQYLILNSNNISSVPDEMWLLTNLQNLSLDHNHLKYISEKIGSLTNLKLLALNSNFLTQIPPQISLLTNLEELTLGYNQFAILPAKPVTLTNLRIFHVCL